jgi:glucose/arabinose dehydrogenase
MYTSYRLRAALGALGLVLAALLALASPAPGSAALARSQGGPAVSVITTGLEVPWDIAFLPDGRALVTERTGAVRIVGADGRLSPAPAATLNVSQNGEGGLLGIALDPGFSAARPFVYLTATLGTEMKVQRFRLSDDRLQLDGTVIGGITMGTIHSSGRVRFGPDGAMYVGTGDAGDGWRAQDPALLNGKILRVAPGAYRGAQVTPTIWATGVRNPQGFAWQPGSGRFYSTDHGPTGFDGPSGDDELDLIVQGANYGWPYVRGLDHGPYTAPVHLWATTIAPAGLAFVTLPGSSWTGKALVTGLKGQVLRLLTFDGARVVSDEPLLLNAYGRLRAVTEAPDGAIWVSTSNRDGRGTPTAGDDRILRIVPPAWGTAPTTPPSLPLGADPAPADPSSPSDATPGPSGPGTPSPRDRAGRGPGAPGGPAIQALRATHGAHRGDAVRVTVRFSAAPSGRVALERRTASGWTAFRTARARSRVVRFAFRPTASGTRALRVTYRAGGRAVGRGFLLRVRP